MRWPEFVGQGTTEQGATWRKAPEICTWVYLSFGLNANLHVHRRNSTQPGKISFWGKSNYWVFVIRTIP